MALIEWPFFFNARNYPTHPLPSLDSLILHLLINPQHNFLILHDIRLSFTPLLSLYSWTLQFCNMQLRTIFLLFFNQVIIACKTFHSLVSGRDLNQNYTTHFSIINSSNKIYNKVNSDLI